MEPRAQRFLRCSDLLVLNPHRQNRSKQHDSFLLRQVSRLDAVIPPLAGKQIRLETQLRLTAYRQLLLSGGNCGTSVYAGSFIRQRQIVLESSLLRSPRLLQAILVHELFHFAWVRLSNGARQRFSCLMREEERRGARGEVGESAGVHKAALALQPGTRGSFRWRNYVCESFCDTAAAVFLGRVIGPQPHLAQRWLERRQKWFAQMSETSWRV